MTFHLSIRPPSRPLYNADSSRVVDGFRMDGIVSKRIYMCVCVCVRILVILFTRGGSFLFFLSFLGEDSSIFNFFFVTALTREKFVIDFVRERGKRWVF